ncbi:50S ribosomal protein L3 [Candidatus Clavichlamydia salmonicola]|uniref:50S ribosomal protein L3 n=1 Tax=Candidatus Clavichlamydia salmonicola TaxID=469812 RepID=UPI001891BBD4|nr:50S ribosomal protein L3 [Candidatus Clavichlamydia salmonicola]MBF5050747.1 50S ribosomal protein L3 [Candidatus Clavichlamydia salmonicola]
MNKTLMGIKKGMTQLFDEQGNAVSCTVLLIEPNVVVQTKVKANEGYDALQLGYGKVIVSDPRTMEKRVTKPLLGHFKKANVPAFKKMREVRTDFSDAEWADIVPGAEFGLEWFNDVTAVDVCSTSKGKGFQGVMKRYHFRGGPASHGSGFHRHGGSTGMRSTPGRCLSGQKKAGRMGGYGVTVKNLSVFKIDLERKLLLVQGGVPGGCNGWVSITESFASAKNKK